MPDSVEKPQVPSAAELHHASATPTSAPPLQGSHIRRLLHHPITHVIAAFLVFGMLQAFFVKPFVVPSGSMQQTLQVSDRILVNRTAFWSSAPAQGDIVVFRASEAWNDDVPDSGASWKQTLKRAAAVFGYGPGTDHYLVKRVVAVAGQHVACCNDMGKVMVDGTALDEQRYVFDDYPFVPGRLDCHTSPASARCFDEVTLPERSLFVLGDHRSNSKDSAIECRSRAVDDTVADCARWVSTDDIVGRAFLVFWPLGRIHTLD